MKTDLILCPIDYSLNSSVAFDLVCNLAKPGSSKVVLLHVKGDNDQPLGLQDSWMQQAESKLRDQILIDNSIEVEHITRTGDPVETIVAVAKAKHADIIVMGTHGRTGLRRLMMGSVAQGVLADAPCLVVTVRPEGNE